MRKGGYSLIELLVVVAIIGILGTLGTYAWNSSGKRSRDSVRKSDLSRMKNALQQHYLAERSYPEYDSSQGNLYAASWQLSNNTVCSHGAEKTEFLTPDYISEIPQDPNGRINFSQDSCPELIDQQGQYLYLAGPQNSLNPREFALLATLEASQNDEIPAEENPVATNTGDNFRDYAVGLGQEPNFFDPNYMIKGRTGR